MAKNKAATLSSAGYRARGVYADLATPRRAHSTEADAAAFLDYLDSVSRAGASGEHVDGLVLFGSTGEFIHFDIAERMRAAGLAIRRSRVPVLIGVSHSTLEGALELAEQAVAIDATGVLLMPPYFYPYPEDQVANFFERFAQQCEPTQIYLHNSPLSANRMNSELVRRLLDTGLFAGVLSEQRIEPNLCSSQQVSLLGGDEALAENGELRSGIVSAIASAVPELPVSLYRALSQGKIDRARRLQAALGELRARLAGFPTVLALKQAAIARGWMKPLFAVPPDSAMEAGLSDFQAWFVAWLPDVLSACATKE
ncbi:MAG: dihydrodipicolinate synthase family protein [Bryobacteraceae bacterium]